MSGPAVTTADLYRDCLEAASECVKRARNPEEFAHGGDNLPAMAAKGYGAAALSLIQSAVTLRKAAEERSPARRRP